MIWGGINFAMTALLVRYLGRISYCSALSLQTELVTKYKSQDHYYTGEILLCEHDPPVYTYGLRQQDFQEDAKILRALGADVVKTRRGGLTTFHGLGQLVCYPIVNLHKAKVGVRQYIHCLEQAVIKTCNHFNIVAATTQNVGVWVNDEKICAIGVQVSRGVAYHGLALNCSTDLSWFDHIVPCGIEGKRVTSFSQLLGRTVAVSEVASILISSLSAELQLPLA